MKQIFIASGCKISDTPVIMRLCIGEPTLGTVNMLIKKRPGITSLVLAAVFHKKVQYSFQRQTERRCAFPHLAMAKGRLAPLVWGPGSQSRGTQWGTLRPGSALE